MESQDERRVTTSLSPARIARQIEALRRRRPEDRVIGFHSKTAWAGGSTLRAGQEEIEVAPCRSELEIRERLCDRAKEAPPLVVLTALDETKLAEDVLARLSRRKLYRVAPWEMIQEMFSAREIDARLGRSPWLVDALLEGAGNESFPPAPGGFLSEDLVWEALLSRALKIESGRPDLTTLLDWTRGHEVEQFGTLSERLREGLRGRVLSTAGSAGPLLIDAVAAGHGRDALALGLVFDVVFADEGLHEVELATARGRLERYVGDQPVPAAAARSWARAARESVRGITTAGRVATVADQIGRAESLLAEIGALSFVHLSEVLPAGLNARLARVGTAIDEILNSSGELDTLHMAAQTARAHAQLGERDDRRGTLDMAERLCRLLATTPTEPKSFAEAALAYAREGALVDRALNALIGGDPQPALSNACERLRGAVVERVESEARVFAELLRGWTEADSANESLLPIESVLDRVVAPVARTAPVLLVVLDGMSGAVFEEIASDLTRPESGWLALRPVAEERSRPTLALSTPPVIAALPTLTHVSRASLLCGALTNGAQNIEKKGFVGHSGLCDAASAQYPPVLFHKAELSGRHETDLSDEVRDAVAAPERKIIGVVLNAVDDFLAKSDQLRHPWRVDSIQLLGPLLEAARAAGRVIILTSDHGHILETGTERSTKADSDRYRLSASPPAEGEVVLAGRRVAESLGGRVVAPWSRKLRYASKKNGYHGGASPQEVVVPLGVFAPLGLRVDGWDVTALHRPDWWLGAAPVFELAPEPRPTKRRPMKQAPTKGQQDLFTPASTDVEIEPQPVREPEWLAPLLGSEIFRQQRAAAGRVAPAEDRVRLVLCLIDERGGKLTRAALVQKLELPIGRVHGIVTSLRRILNVDGYDVLAIDEASDSLSLNLQLLKTQFGI